jgi:molybdate transport system regulatory protein
MFLMNMLWVICGAGRSVGKTTLALNLCRVLPNSHYAECVPGTKKSRTSQTFFENVSELEAFMKDNPDSYEHWVVESNALARTGRPDVMIFIDGIEPATDFQKEAASLREKAHVCLCRHSKAMDWKKRLSGKIASKSLCNKIGDVLVSQKHYLFGSAPAVRSKIWFESAGEHIFGIGLARLLEKVDRLGTLQAAAKNSDMSYRYAWDLIRAAEKHLGHSLIERHSGGADGGGSMVSDQGRQMLKAFRQINNEVSAYADTRFEKFFNGVNSNAGD